MINIERIYKIADNIKKEYNGQSVSDIIKDLGIKIFFKDLGTEENCLKSFCLLTDYGNCITINSNLSESQTDIILAHELGHVLLHNCLKNDIFIETNTFLNAGKCEAEANFFAAELLLDDEVILDNFEFNSFYATAAINHIYPELLYYKIIILKLKGYKINDTPFTPQNDFLKSIAI